MGKGLGWGFREEFREEFVFFWEREGKGGVGMAGFFGGGGKGWRGWVVGEGKGD